MTARLDRHRRRVARSLEIIQEARVVGAIGISFSGGKDSTCILDLVRQVDPDAPAAFFDSGCELDSTLALVAALGVETITPRLSMLDIARYSGWWGFADPVDQGCPFDAKAILIQEPSETFVVRRRLRVIAHGVRAEESGGRARHIRARGHLYQAADRTWYCMPIAHWDVEDVWAYIASRELRYNAAYDAMSAMGLPREAQRVAGLLGERGSGWGRHHIANQIARDRWRTLRAEFPRLGT